MGVLITGLVIFIGVHLTRVLGIKALTVRVTGEALFAIFYSVISTIGLTLIIYGQILAHPSDTIWQPPAWTRTVALVAVPLSLVLIFATYLPSHIRSVTRHPMTLGVFLWSGSHLLANGELASIVLFGAFAAWSLILLVEGYLSGGHFARPGVLWADLTAILLGLLSSALIAYFHMQLFGVAVVEFASNRAAPGI